MTETHLGLSLLQLLLGWGCTGGDSRVFRLQLDDYQGDICWTILEHSNQSTNLWTMISRTMPLNQSDRSRTGTWYHFIRLNNNHCIRSAAVKINKENQQVIFRHWVTQLDAIKFRASSTSFTIMWHSHTSSYISLCFCKLLWNTKWPFMVKLYSVKVSTAIFIPAGGNILQQMTWNIWQYQHSCCFLLITLAVL